MLLFANGQGKPFQGRAAQLDLVVDTAAREVQRVLVCHILQVDPIKEMGTVDPQTVWIHGEVTINQHRAQRGSR